METRIVSTLISQAPRKKAFTVAVAIFIFIWIVSELNWTKLSPIDLSSIRQNVFEQGEVWRLFSSTLIHQDLAHLFSNGYMLVILIGLLLNYFGALPIILSFFVLTPLTHAWALSTYEPHVRLLGASGWVYILASCWLILYFLIDRRKSLSTRLVRTLGVGLLILFPTKFDPTVSDRTHAIGFILGIPLAIVIFLINQKRIRESEIIEVIVDETLESLAVQKSDQDISH